MLLPLLCLLAGPKRHRSLWLEDACLWSLLCIFPDHCGLSLNFSGVILCIIGLYEHVKTST